MWVKKSLLALLMSLAKDIIVEIREIKIKIARIETILDKGTKKHESELEKFIDSYCQDNHQ